MQEVKLLDYGYLKYVNHMGRDEEIIEDARMSTAKGFRTWNPYVECTKCGVWWEVDEGICPCEHPSQCWKKAPKGDAGLLAYLRSNRHTTPFEGCVLKIELQAPIMVFREWHRHRTQSYNEMSGRYIPLPDVNYIPSVERLMLNSKINKQAGVIDGADELTVAKADQFRVRLQMEYREQQEMYEWALQAGVPKELARVHIGVGRYSRMRATANLKNWLDFMTLRSDFTESGKKAQWEIRQYANEVGHLIAKLFPKTWELFIERK